MAHPRQQRIDPAKIARGAKKGSPAARPKATAADWIAAARLRTLSLSIAPVALGSATASVAHGFDLTIALLCLAVAVLLQIGVNYANDYSDGVRGTDNFRVGPSRLTGSGAAKPKQVLTVALAFMAAGALAGAAVIMLSQHWWLFAVGAVALVAAWFYTGGKRPYGYYGLGEIVSFLFFGIVATVGTTFVQLDRVTPDTWVAAVAIGLFVAAVMLVNNLRDRAQDALAGKRTLSVLIGDRASRVLFAVLMLAPYGLLVFFTLFYPRATLVYFTLLAALPTVLIVLTAKTSREFILALKLTSLTALLFGLGLAAAIAF
ncbi:1,4-dihydroxy-2-naphthoate polyprenyltransferase [Salinibacterium sp. ZJ454]|uniref:1,4-dihydroxy-2-naphthoate polyprenyltransferase n=1 Tax=Salinibacterium sp. ZJ454 TaxID=2708339 RepID=UPI00141FB3EE|nr:1,4-dihydroxy-2-naphthoate polyprenyltransferase [Salinibacterium sp. ZJ454]